MSYKLQYTSNFNNELNELVEISIFRKDMLRYAGAAAGVKGEYFNTDDLTGPVILERTDLFINFGFSPGSPDPAINSTHFSVRWTGQIKAAFTETYTFKTQSDDGVRLWVNDVLIIDNWTVHSTTIDTGTINLVAGRKYNIRMEYFQSTSDALIALYWSSASLSEEIVPGEAFTSDPVVPITNFPCSDCKVNVNGDDSDLFDSILCRELVFNLEIEEGDPVDWQTFIASNYDDWKVSATIDSMPLFDGYLVPDEGPSPFQDKPYEITMRCTDGLKLLQKITLSKADGTEFNSKHTPIEYISAILSKTNLALDIKVYCNIYNNAMFVRDSDIKFDMFAQCRFDYRTFMTSATDFVDCYAALQILFKEHFRLYYWNGMWVIYRIPEYQYIASDRFFTMYNSAGVVQSGGIDPENYAEIGKGNLIYPINENQTLASRFANKSVKHTYNYVVWDEIPRNNKFERATIDNTIGDATTKYYTILDWSYGKMLSSGSLPGQTATTFKAWRKSTYNAYGIETDREIRLQTGPDGLKSLQSDSIPVNANDKVAISFQIKLSVDISPGDYPAVAVYIKGATFTWFMDDDGSWKHPGGNVYVDANYISGEDSSNYKSISVESFPIPEDGELYIAFQSNNLGGSDIFFKDFNFTYTPYIAGGYLPVTGDYWQRVQNANIPDTKSEEIQISDAKGVFKGAFWSGPDAGTLRVLTPQWYRWGLTESRHFKELVNIGSFNLTYRRFWKIEGDFNSTGYMANNVPGTTVPLSFTPRYGFMDLNELRLFVMICPVEIDVLLGRFTTTFIEVLKDDMDGTQEGNTATFNYLFS